MNDITNFRPCDSCIRPHISAPFEIAVLVHKIMEQDFKLLPPFCLGEKGYIGINGLLRMISYLRYYGSAGWVWGGVTVNTWVDGSVLIAHLACRS